MVTNFDVLIRHEDGNDEMVIVADSMEAAIGGEGENVCLMRIDLAKPAATYKPKKHVGCPDVNEVRSGLGHGSLVGGGMVFILVENGKPKILLLKRDDYVYHGGLWSIPAGGSEENPSETSYKEFAEEAVIIVSRGNEKRYLSLDVDDDGESRRRSQVAASQSHDWDGDVLAGSLELPYRVMPLPVLSKLKVVYSDESFHEHESKICVYTKMDNCFSVVVPVVVALPEDCKVVDCRNVESDGQVAELFTIDEVFKLQAEGMTTPFVDTVLKAIFASIEKDDFERLALSIALEDQEKFK